LRFLYPRNRGGFSCSPGRSRDRRFESSIRWKSSGLCRPACTRRHFGASRNSSRRYRFKEICHLFPRALAPVADEQEKISPASPPRLEAGFRGAASPPLAVSTARRTARVEAYNEMHGRIVGLGKQYSRKKAAWCEASRCEGFFQFASGPVRSPQKVAIPLPALPGPALHLDFRSPRRRKRSSGFYFIPAGESAIANGLPWTGLSLLAGWWGIRWGRWGRSRLWSPARIPGSAFILPLRGMQLCRSTEPTGLSPQPTPFSMLFESNGWGNFPQP